MPDTRSADDMVAMVVALEARINDLESTVIPRLVRTFQTGDIEPTLRSAEKTGTLFLKGQTVSRATYPILWQWVQDQGLIIPNYFTIGDGSTTFGLPNFGGKVLIGVGTFGSDTYALGAMVGEARHTLTLSETPNHDHNVGGNSGTTGSSGSHSGHNSGSTGAASALPGSQDFFFSVASSTQNSNGSHTHGGGSLNVSESAMGGGGSHENRQVSMAINWAIYT